MPKRKKGRARNVTPIEIDGIQFRSKLEGYCYKLLKSNKIPFYYERHSFILIKSFSFPNDSWEYRKVKGEKVFTKTNPTIRAITYKPDFTNLKEGWIIECKGMMNDAFPLRWKLLKRYIAENKLSYDLYMPRNKKQVEEVVNLIKEKYESNRSPRRK